MSVQDTAARQEEGRWITVKGNRIFIKKGETPREAVTRFVEQKRRKSGWHVFKHGNVHEKRLYEKGKVIAKIPIKNIGQGFTKEKILEKAKGLGKTPITEEKKIAEMSKKELIAEVKKCRAGDFIVYDFRDDMSISDSIQDCVSKSIEEGRDLGQAYLFCSAAQDFFRMTPEEYLEMTADFTEDAKKYRSIREKTEGPLEKAKKQSIGALDKPKGGGPPGITKTPGLVRPMLTLAEAVSQYGSGKSKTTSSHITKVGYFNSMLEVEFKNGSRYVYFVGPEMYDKFINSPSKGEFLWKELRGKRPGLVFDDPKKKTPGGVPFHGGKGSLVPYSKGSMGTPEGKGPPQPSIPSTELERKELEIAFKGSGLKWTKGLPGIAATGDFTMSGFITRSGEFDYGPNGIKTKDWPNVKKRFQEAKHFPIFGTSGYGAHTEGYDRLLGYTHDWEFFEPGVIDKDGHVFAKQEFFKDISELSDLGDPSDLPVSMGFIDIGEGDVQNILKWRHLAVSLNKLEGDRCNTVGGLPCNISKGGDFMEREEEDYPVKEHQRGKVKIKAHTRGESKSNEIIKYGETYRKLSKFMNRFGSPRASKDEAMDYIKKWADEADKNKDQENIRKLTNVLNRVYLGREDLFAVIREWMKEVDKKIKDYGVIKRKEDKKKVSTEERAKIYEKEFGSFHEGDILYFKNIPYKILKIKERGRTWVKGSSGSERPGFMTYKLQNLKTGEIDTDEEMKWNTERELLWTTEKIERGSKKIQFDFNLSNLEKINEYRGFPKKVLRVIRTDLDKVNEHLQSRGRPQDNFNNKK